MKRSFGIPVLRTCPTYHFILLFVFLHGENSGCVLDGSVMDMDMDMD